MTSTDLTLTCYGFPNGTDPHEVRIPISSETYQAFRVHRSVETDLPMGAHGEWFVIADIHEGAWEVRSAPCGAECRCGAQARRV